MCRLKMALRIWNGGEAEFNESLKRMSDKGLCQLKDSIEGRIGLIRDCENGVASKPFFYRLYDVKTLQDMLVSVWGEIRFRNLLRLQRIEKCLGKAISFVESGLRNKDIPYLDGVELAMALREATDCADECCWDLRALFKEVSCEKTE